MKINKQLALILLQLIRPALAVTLALIAVNFISGQMVITSKLIQEKRTAYATLERRIEAVEIIKKEFARVPQNTLERMQAVFPPSDNIIGFIVAIESLASRSFVGQNPSFGTPTQFAKKGEGTSAADISSIAFNLSLTGNAANIVKYLAGLEKMPFLTSISDIQITSGGVNGWESSASEIGRGMFYAKTIK